MGTKRVKGIVAGSKTATRRSGVHSEAGGHQTIGRVQPVMDYADLDGLETIPAWVCPPSCAVWKLDEQSGELKSAIGRPGVQKGSNAVVSFNGKAFSIPGQNQYGDTGGASRFFPQFEDEAALDTWLLRLILGDR